MIAAIINAVLVIIGGLVGVIFGRFIKPRVLEILMSALGICVMIIGIMGAVKVQDMLGMIVCIVIGTIIGEMLDIERRIDSLGGLIKNRLGKGADKHGKFTEGFLTASVLFCVGSMAILGSIEAGINHNYSIIISKSIIDCVTAVSLAAAMGVGVIFSAVCILVYQGLLTLGAGAFAEIMSPPVVLGISAVGGAMLIATGFNMLNFKHIRVANMLPAIFLPIVYAPFAEWLSNIVGM